MIATRRRNAFTLIEVLIVVIIMAVLAATIIPQFSSSTNDAKNSSSVFNLHTIRSQIEMYKVHHLGKVPAFATFADQMTKPTDVNGATTGTTLPYGPYFQGQVPANPFNGSNTLVAVGTAGSAPTGPNGSTAGWQYDATTGGFFPNTDATHWDYTNDKPL
jgi:general secretion pathway protein G